MQMQGSFNSNQFEPNQGGGASHPPAQKVPFTITATAIVENKAKDGGMFVVDLTSPLGTQIHRYNIWNKEPKAVEIAHGQLSALCRATGRYQIDWSNEGAALRGAQGLMDIGYQKGEEPTAEKPQGGYTELKRVYDLAGNDPAKPGAAQAQPQGQQGGFGGQQQPQPQAQQNAPQPQGGPTPMVNQGGGWGNQQPQQTAQQQPQVQQQQPQQNAQQGGQAWQPGGGAGAGGATPPWGNR